MNQYQNIKTGEIVEAQLYTHGLRSFKSAKKFVNKRLRGFQYFNYPRWEQCITYICQNSRKFHNPLRYAIIPYRWLVFKADGTFITIGETRFEEHYIKYEPNN